jgi:hypothetical protein
MKSFKKALLYGFLIWLTVFVVAFMIFPIRESNRPFFESIMPVAISIATVFFSYSYFKNVEDHFLKEGFLLGVLFMLVNWIIDAVVMLSPSPMQMSPQAYFHDIGFTYLMILPITIGFGLVLKKLKSHNEESSAET